MTLGQKVKYRRMELGYTQSELAQKTQTSQPYISQLENDKFIENMYQQYHGLGGNGVMTQLHTAFMELPTEKESDR